MSKSYRNRVTVAHLNPIILINYSIIDSRLILLPILQYAFLLAIMFNHIVYKYLIIILCNLSCYI